MQKPTGIRYNCFLTSAEDQAVQEVGNRLAKDLQLWDARRKKFITPTNDARPISRYAIAKHALRLLLEKYGYSEDLCRPDSKLRAEKRRRTIL